MGDEPGARSMSFVSGSSFAGPDDHEDLAGVGQPLLVAGQGVDQPQRRCVCIPVFIAFLLYVQFTCVVGILLDIIGISISQAALCAHYLRVLGTRFAHTPNSATLIDDSARPVIFLSNHRSWGDFWVDGVLFGAPSFVARRLVAIGIPFAALWGFLQGRIWFFNRVQKHPEGVVQWFVAFYQRNHELQCGKGCVMYPEGTRSTLPHSLPLKPGGLAVAFELGWPVQIVITTNKEVVMAEKVCGLAYGVQVVSSIAEPIHPNEHSSKDSFMEAVRSTWERTWQDAYECSNPVRRPKASLPGCVPLPNKISCPGTRRLNIARAIIMASLVGVCIGVNYST